VRTFLALEIDESTRSRLVDAQRQIDTAGAKMRWVAPENLHVTLKFLGEVADRDLAEVAELTAAAAGEVQPFEFDVRGLIAVPARRQLRMVWAGVDDPTGRVGRLAGLLEDALVGPGIPAETRALKPHITMARIKHARDPDGLRRQVDALGKEEFGTIAATEVVVFTSELTPSGPIYTPVARAALG